MRFLPRKNRKPPTVIVVALIDVLMVVLIFMVVSTTFKNQAAVSLALPESSQAKKEPSVNRPLIVTVAKNPPYFYIGADPIGEGALEEEIKKAVESMFDVKVQKVSTMNRIGKEKNMTVRSGGRTIRTNGKRSNWKKAFVTLKEGESLDLLDTESS